MTCPQALGSSLKQGDRNAVWLGVVIATHKIGRNTTTRFASLPRKNLQNGTRKQGAVITLVGSQKVTRLVRRIRVSSEER